MVSIGGGEVDIGCSADGEEGLRQECAAGVELAGVGLGEGVPARYRAKRPASSVSGAGGVDGGDGCGDGGALLQLAGSPASSFGQSASAAN